MRKKPVRGAETRRRFMACFAGLGLGSTLAPGIIWARMQDAGAQRITLAMVTEALKLSGVESTEAEREAMVQAANQNLTRYEELRKIPLRGRVDHQRVRRPRPRPGVWASVSEPKLAVRS